VGKAREEARHSVKKISKEVCRLFHKKLAIDVQTEGTGSGSGGTFGGSSKSRKHSSRIEFNFELTMQRFLSLSYFDRHAVASQAVSACLEMISGFTSGSGSSSAYLPVLEHLSFLFDLFEVSLSISGLIDLCLQLLKGKT
jgi:mediator of RNA polymerase II transcription subunit 12